MITRKQKEDQIKNLSLALKESKSNVICDYKGASVAQLSELRKSLRPEGAKFQVFRKTLIQKALEEVSAGDLGVRKMPGQIAITVGGKDEVSVAKKIFDFSKKCDKIKILAGLLEGKILLEKEVINLAKLPSKEQLLGKFVGTIKAPVSGFVGVLKGNLRGLVIALNAIKESKNA